MPARRKRPLFRILIATAFCLAIGATAISMTDTTGRDAVMLP